MRSTWLVATCLGALAVAPSHAARLDGAPKRDDPAKLLAAYARLDRAPRKGKVDAAWKKRIDLEFRLVRAGKAAPLRAALTHKEPDVRAFAARALGILGDRRAAPALERLAATDAARTVRIMALQSLGWLRTGKAVVKAAQSDANRDIRFMAGVAAAHHADQTNHAKEVRAAYQAPLPLSALGSAAVGKKAPHFTATDPGGKPFRLKNVLGKRIVVLTFQLADW